jgi:Porin subfamily
MITKRNIGTMAAIGGFTAAIALLSGLPSAKADELTDLRANQQLLQQRVDQLAQIQHVPGSVYPYGAPPKTAGAGIVGGSFPRSFLVPGTDTSIRVGGQIWFEVFYWLTGGNPHGQRQINPGSTGTMNTVPLSQGATKALAQGHAVWSEDMSRTKLNFETRTPSAWGEARTFVEFDFAADAGGSRPLAISNSTSLRLRYAYGTLGGWLGGQANSNFSDSDAGLETITFGGLVGGSGPSRLPQLRYTMPLSGWGLPGALSFSAETPETDFWSPGTSVIGQYASGVAGGNPLKASAPDLTAAWYIPQPWGHVDFSGVVRPALQLKDGGPFVDRNFVGWGVHFSGDVKPHWFGWNKDYIVWSVQYGDGVGRYFTMGSGNGETAMVSNYTAALGATAPGAATIRVKTVPAWGGYIGYRHNWTPTVHSNIGWGVAHQDIDGLNGVVCALSNPNRRTGATAPAAASGCNLNEETSDAVVNVIWSPVPFVDVGLEYLWGHRFTTGGQRGDEHVIGSKFVVKF